MPIPTPEKDEKEQDFISRCMSNETMKEEYPDNDQRLAVCYGQWREKDKDQANAKGKYYEIRAKTEKSEDDAEILLYGEIGESWFSEGNGAKQFVEDLKAVKNAKRLSIRINSGGGCVFDGLAIFNAIDRHSARKTVYIDGLAASISSVIAMVGESVIMAENAMFMIHKPFGGVVGNAIEMRKIADALDKIEEGMITSYQRKSKFSGAKLAAMMAYETWMTAKEALENGFVTEIGKAMQMAASVRLDPKHYKNLPKRFLLPPGGSDGPQAELIKQYDARLEKFRPEWSREALLNRK